MKFSHGRTFPPNPHQNFPGHWSSAMASTQISDTRTNAIFVEELNLHAQYAFHYSIFGWISQNVAVFTEILYCWINVRTFILKFHSRLSSKRTILSGHMTYNPRYLFASIKFLFINGLDIRRRLDLLSFVIIASRINYRVHVSQFPDVTAISKLRFKQFSIASCVTICVCVCDAIVSR